MCLILILNSAYLCDNNNCSNDNNYYYTNNEMTNHPFYLVVVFSLVSIFFLSVHVDSLTLQSASYAQWIIKKNGENNTKTGNNSLRRFQDAYIWRVAIL